MFHLKKLWSGRCHTVSQFNKGVYSVIVAADETLLDEGQTPKVSHKQATPLETDP